MTCAKTIGRPGLRFLAGAGLAMAVTFAAGEAARAGFVGSELVWITMTDDAGQSASVGIANPYDDATGDTTTPEQLDEWLSEQVTLTDGTSTLGQVDALSVHLDGDPVASISFAVTAGASDVTVTVSSATVSFATLTNPPASASAEVTLTDNGGDPATLTTLDGHDGLFEALYNGSSTYAYLLGDSSISGGAVAFDQSTTSGPIAGDVSSIQARFAFKLSAFDSAAGEGEFVVVPEPASAAVLLSLASAALLARRTRR